MPGTSTLNYRWADDWLVKVSSEADDVGILKTNKTKTSWPNYYPLTCFRIKTENNGPNAMQFTFFSAKEKIKYEGRGLQ